MRSDPAAPLLTIQGGTNGVLVDDTLRINGALVPEASLPFLSLSGGTSVQVLSPLLEQIAVGPTNGTVGVVVWNTAATGEASLLLDANSQGGVAELKVLAGGGVQLNSIFQFISMNNTVAVLRLSHRSEAFRWQKPKITSPFQGSAGVGLDGQISDAVRGSAEARTSLASSPRPPGSWARPCARP